MIAAIPTDRGDLGNAPSVQGMFRRCLAELTFKLDYYDNDGMPSAVMRFEPLLEAAKRVIPLFGHHKFLHYRRWFRRELAGYLRETVEDGRVRGSAIWNPRAVRRMADEHISGARNRIVDIGAVATVQAIERILLQTRD